MLRTALAAVCISMLVGTAYLTLSLIVLRPQRASFLGWSIAAAFFGAQSALTVLALAWELSGVPTWFRHVLLGGAVTMTFAGAWWVSAALASPHFEGYAVALGAIVAAQGALTLVYTRLRRLPLG